MKTKVTMRELVGARIVLAVCIAVYYWCWARNDWHSYYTTITNTVGIFALCFYVFLSLREDATKKRLPMKWSLRIFEDATRSASQSHGLPWYVSLFCAQS